MDDVSAATAVDGFVAEDVLPRSAAVDSRYGRLLTISSDRFASESVRRYGEWAQQELNLIGSLLVRGDWAVDGGAYIGTHTLAFSRFVGPSGQVISVEPRREVFRLLQANVEEVNQLGNVRLLNHALGDHHGSLELSFLSSDAERANPGGQPVSDMRDADSVYPVTIVTLDSLDLQRLDFLKLDVEGAEASVLLGAQETITRHQPFVFVELNSIGLGAEVLAVMRKHEGYQAFGSISAAFNPRNHSGCSENIFADAVETALLFVPETKLDHVRALVVSFQLAPVYSIDEIALVLLHKPQYASEILQDTAAAQRFGLSYPSPLAQRLIQEQTARTEAHAAELGRVNRAHAKESAAQARAHGEEMAARQQAHSREVALGQQAHTRELGLCQQGHAREIDVFRQAHAHEIELLKQAHAREVELCQQAHASALDAARTATEASLAAAQAASEKALWEQADAMARAYSKQVVALTAGHTEKLRAISRENEMQLQEAARRTEAAHERMVQHERVIAALHASRSWQLMAPLRRASTIVRRALGRGAR